ncbi:MAG: ABC transporter ATP-binding protein [Sporolactobacillus sp.]
MIYTIDNLSKTFQGKQTHTANHNISFSINEGEIFSILGNNGAGKTTLIKQMLKIITPTSGEILFEGENIKKISNRWYYKQVNAVLEGNRNLYWYLTGSENIMYFGRLFGYRDRELKMRCKELLEFFDLYEDRNKKVGYYSRGMQQKIAIIVALINKPKVLFLDEPTLGLDIHAKKDVIRKVRSLSKDQHTTIILTSHQLDVIEQLADKVMILEKGERLFLGDIDKLKRYYSQNKYHVFVKSVLAREKVALFFSEFQWKIINGDTHLVIFVENDEEMQTFLAYLISNKYKYL